MRFLLGLIPALLSWSTVASPPAISVPALNRPVIDEAGFLPQASVQEIEGILLEMRREGKGQMAIYIPRTLGGEDIEGFSMRVAEAWRLGKKGEDKGLLLILAPAERQMRLEVGYGLEGEIPDAMARRLLENVLRPSLRDQRPGDGVLQLVRVVASTLKVQGVPPVTENIESSGPRFSSMLVIFMLLFFVLFRDSGVILFLPALAFTLMAGRLSGVALLILIIGIFLMIRKKGWRAHRSHSGLGRGTILGGGGWGRGGFGGGGLGGGGFSGGGGGFGGGGASSRW